MHRGATACSSTNLLHGSAIEIIAENERSYWLYQALGLQDQALPEIKLDQKSLPRACFAPDGNIMLY